MRTAKWQNIIYIFLLLAAIFLLFQWYSATNSRQIEERNLNYAMDSARQAALRLDSELLNGLRRVRNYAYLLSTTMQEPDVGTDLLHQPLLRRAHQQQPGPHLFHRGNAGGERRHRGV